MALTIEDGTVVTGADAFEDAATTAARLVALNLTSFNSKAESVQEAIIRRRTIECETKLKPGIEGTPVEATQARLFPRARCWDLSGRILSTSEIPEDLLAGIAHRCEDDAAGRVGTGGLRALSRKDGEGEVTYRDGGGSKMALESPEAAAHLANLFWAG